MQTIYLRSVHVYYTTAQVLEKYCASNRPSMPNSWSYVLEQPGGGRSTASQEEGAASGSSRPPSPLGQGATKQQQHPTSLITKFTKVLSQEERAMVRKKKIFCASGVGSPHYPEFYIISQ